MPLHLQIISRHRQGLGERASKDFGHDGGTIGRSLESDWVLPGGINGRALADEVKRRRPGIKVIFLSGYTENAIVHHGRLDAGVHLLHKPFRKADLARKVRTALDSR